MKDFIAVATKEDAKKKKAPKESITFKHHGTDVTFYKPGQGKLLILMSMARRNMDKKTAGTFIAMFFEMMDEDTQIYFENRLMDDDDDFGLSSEGGIYDIWKELAEEWSDRPTKAPSGSASSRRSTGNTSKGSTRSTPAKTSGGSRSRSSSR